MNELIMSDFFRAAELMANGWRLSNIRLNRDEFYPNTPEVSIKLVPRKNRQIKLNKPIEQIRLSLFEKIKKKDLSAWMFRFTDVNMVIDPSDFD